MGFDTISGVPSHPLFVHIPVVGIPLVALLFFAYLVLPSKRSGLFWPTAVGIAFVTVATILAASTGESLEEKLSPEDRASSTLRHHTQLGEQTRTIVIVFAVVTLGYLAAEWWKSHRSSVTASNSGSNTISSFLANPTITKLIVGVGIIGILLGGVATVWDVRTGHAGAKSAWGDVSTESTESGDDD